MGRVSQRHHSTEISWSEHHLIVCITRNTSLAGGLLFQDELWGWAYVVLHMCVCAHFTLPCMSNLRVRVTFMPPSPKSCSQFILAAESGAGSRMKEALEIMELFKVMNSVLIFLFFLSQFCNTQKENSKTHQIILSKCSHPLCLCNWTSKSETIVKMMKLYVHSSGEQGDKNIVTIILSL